MRGSKKARTASRCSSSQNPAKIHGTIPARVVAMRAVSASKLCCDQAHASSRVSERSACTEIGIVTSFTRTRGSRPRSSARWASAGSSVLARAASIRIRRIASSVATSCAAT